MSGTLSGITYEMERVVDRTTGAVYSTSRRCSFSFVRPVRGGSIETDVPLTGEEMATLMALARAVYKRHRAEEYDRLREEMMGESKA